MGFFSKKQSSDADRKQRSMNEPFIADDQTMARVAELMRMFNDAVGNTAMENATARGISSAAGLDDLKQLLVPDRDKIKELMQRPWKMLAAVALRAAQNGDYVLVGRIFGFTYHWETQIAPQLTRADMVDVLLHGSPSAIESEIATVALGSLQQLPGDQVILSNATGSLTAEVLTRAAAIVLVDAPEKGVPVDDVVMAVAKSFVG
jgi:hypothetical protein